jgi:dienelactone hydrolase
MRRFLVCVVVAVVSGCGGHGDEGKDLFGYDAKAPLDVRERSQAPLLGNVTVHGITYASPKGGRVPALLMIPAGKGPFAGLIVQHGQPGRGADLADEGQRFARLGAVVVLIDAPFARRSGEPVRFDERDRREQIQLIVDLRRAVDLLLSRNDVDKARIGYFGVSYGAAMGGLLAGVEHRIAAFVLRVGDGGLVEHFGTRHDKGGWLPPMSPTRHERWLAAMRPIEALRWVRRATAPLLFQSGRKDDIVPPPDARRYQAAAPEPKEVKWYNAGHFLPLKADCDAAAWLARYIGTSPDQEECGPSNGG